MEGRALTTDNSAPLEKTHGARATQIRTCGSSRFSAGRKRREPAMYLARALTTMINCRFGCLACRRCGHPFLVRTVLSGAWPSATGRGGASVSTAIVGQDPLARSVRLLPVSRQPSFRFRKRGQAMRRFDGPSIWRPTVLMQPPGPIRRHSNSHFLFGRKRRHRSASRSRAARSGLETASRWRKHQPASTDLDSRQRPISTRRSGRYRVQTSANGAASLLQGFRNAPLQCSTLAFFGSASR